MVIGVTASLAVDSGMMMTFGEDLALAEAVVTISGTVCLVDGDHEAQAVARGVVHRVAGAMAAEVHTTHHGALAEEGRGTPV